MGDSGEGVPSKPSPKAFNIDLGHFKQAVGWVKMFVLKVYGERIVRALHDAYPNVWRFYDENGHMVLNLEHELMERLALVLDQIDWMYEEHLREFDQDEMRELFGEDDGA